ncbi:hypothetical protein Scep_002887 [Stephania cephalantha]|uniref:Uncharacterized protein n=1 Tax=Stephania cephalantha TaxID=152367 RepID=A0AAP0Q977_9MAGN
MSLPIQLAPLISLSNSSQNLQFHRPNLRNPTKIAFYAVQNKLRIAPIRAVSGSNGGDDTIMVVEGSPRWESVLGTLASLYPVYVTVGGVVACVKPSVFSWYVQRGPGSFSLTLGFIMLAMGLTLELREFLGLFMQRPLSIFFGVAAQYTIMPTFGFLISKGLGLSPALSVGLILLACCPGGTASNVVTLIARGDVALSIVVTVCTTLGAVLLTPLLTKILAGAFVPVDAVKLSISTLQSSVASASLASNNLSPVLRLQEILSGDIGAVILSVMLLHFAGFFVGYLSAAIGGFGESQRRAIAIEVGMQNSSLGVILATSHFTSQMVALPPAMSAVIMNIMGSSLGVIWRCMDPSSPSNSKQVSGDDHEK